MLHFSFSFNSKLIWSTTRTKMNQLRSFSLSEFKNLRENYKGRYYYSSYTDEDFKRTKSKYLVVTSSTMAYINKKHVPELQSIECPGATVAQTLGPLSIELQGMSPEKVVVVLGVNNFLQAQSYVEVCEEAEKVHFFIKRACPRSTVLWVPIPLVPKVCVLPMGTHQVKKNRLLDVLMFNDFLRNKLNRGYSPLSLENIGCNMKNKLYIPGHREAYIVGDKHWYNCWRERQISEAVHLKDALRARFWIEIENYFRGDDTMAYYRIKSARIKLRRRYMM